jgi:hypothetical protein
MCRDAERWLFRLEDHVTWESGHAFSADMAFEDREGVRWLEVTKTGAITILSGYAWDGCSPKLCVLDLVLGTPDGVVDARTGRPKTYYASLVHDAMYQFLGDGLGLPRADADRFLLRLMSATGFTFRYIYFAAVRLLGGLYRGAAKKVRKTDGTRVPLGASLAQGPRIVVQA